MKTKTNLSLIISLLALAVSATLFFLKPSSPEPVTIPQPTNNDGAGLNIAYINADSIMSNYLLVDELMKTLTNQGAAMEKELQKKQSQYESDASYFQEQVNKGTISEASARDIYEKLMAKEQELYQLRDQYSQQMMQLEAEMNKVLLDNVSQFLKNNNNFTYDYVLNYTYNGDILLTNPDYDITKFVLEGLNREYSESKEKIDE